MADKAKEYEEELLKVIKTRKIAFLNHAFAYTSFSSSTAYNHELEKLESVKEAIQNNRVSSKNYMLQKWIDSDNATLQVAAMRLLADAEEHRKLNQSYVQQDSKVRIEASEINDEQVDKLMNGKIDE